MYGVLHTDGSGEDNPAIEKFSDLYDELLSNDGEHSGVSVIDDESGWCLTAHLDGRLVFEQLGSRGSTARHMIPVSKERVLELWRKLTQGEIDDLLKEPWLPGYIVKSSPGY